MRTPKPPRGLLEWEALRDAFSEDFGGHGSFRETARRFGDEG